MPRRTAWPLIAAAIGLIALAALLVSTPQPKVAPRIPGNSGGEVLEARVTRVIEEGERVQGGSPQPFARLEVQALGGSINGATLTVEEQAIGATGQIRHFQAGDHVLLSYSRLPDGSDSAYIAEYVRRPQLLWLALAFALTIIIVGGGQGLRSLFGLLISFLVILRFIIPHILAGENPVLISVTGALIVQVAAMYLAHGLNRKTTAALIGTVFALLLTGALGWLFIQWTRLTGLSSEEASYLSIRAGGRLDLQGLLLSGLIIGTLGVLNDVAISQSSAIFELHALQQRQSARSLIARGMRIGRDHIAATVNTLFLAYAGASLPLLLLLSTRPEPLGALINREFIAVEVVNAMVGSLGLVVAVPLTTAAAALMARRQRPNLSDAPEAVAH